MENAFTEKVLIVEDSKSFSSILKSLIVQAHGFECDIAESMACTKEILKDKSQEYFVAIVDYHLPDAPNGEAIDQVINYNIPSIIFTGSSDNSLSQTLWQKGIADYAHKNGVHNLEHVVWMIKRIYVNRNSEILVIDNNKESCDTIVSLLKRQNFITHCVDTAKGALDILKKNENIHLAIIDDNLDDMSGLELAATVREACPRAIMEIIGISDKEGREFSAKFIKSGASDFVSKPLIPEEFLCRVNTGIERIDAYFELDKLNKVKNQFLGAASHDIRGPLGSIKTAAEFLLKRSPSPERSEKLLNMILSSSSDLLELLETLLDITVIESGVPQLNIQCVDPAKILTERLELYQAEASSKNITVERDISDCPEADLDPLKIKQVFDNIITNAIKYSQQNSTIFLKLSDEKDFFRVSMQDAGPGISEQEQKQLFKAFSVLSTKATGGEKKTGLGLAITKSIVDAHDGKIYYVHNAKQHSTFFVEMPYKLKT